MNIAAWSLKHQSLCLLIFVALLGGGIYSAKTLPSGIYPEVEFPRIAVLVHAGNAPPSVFLATVTRPLEQALMTVLGVQRVRSRTIRGGTEISMLFAPDTNMWLALQLVQAQIDSARASLPIGADVQVERVTPVSFPIISFNVMSQGDSRALLELCEYVIRPVLARVPGVGRVNVKGGDVREVEVLVNPQRAAAARLRLQDIAGRLRTALPLLAAGRYDEDRAMVTIMASAEATDLDDLRQVPLSDESTPLLLGAVSEVREGAEDRFYRVQGPAGETVVITLARLEGESTPEVAENAVAALRQLPLPEGVRVEPVYDQGALVREALASVRDAVLLGVVLCFAVLGFFLRDVRAGLVAGLAVPVTLIITFLAMRVTHQTLNLMSLGGMAVAVGLVVDDAIVIVEAITRSLERGLSEYDAAVEGTNELTAAVVGTTITTVIVCAPLFWVAGIVGKFFAALAITLAAAVVISLGVALVLVPIAAAHLMRPRKPLETGRAAKAYSRLVRSMASRRAIGVSVCLLSVAFIDVALSHVPTGFMPTTDEGAFVLDYLAPAGTSLNEMDSIVSRVEKILRDTPEVETFSRRTGAGLNPTAAKLMNHGDIMVRLRPTPRRYWLDVVSDLRTEITENVPQLQVEFTQVLQDMLNDLSGTPRPIEIKLFGEDYATLNKIAQDLVPKIKQVRGLVDVYSGVEGTSPELTARIDRIAAARLGLTATDVADGIADALGGTLAGVMRRFDRMINIRVRYPDEIRFNPEELARLPLFQNAVLEQAARLEQTSSPTFLMHEGLQPLVLVTGDHAGRDLGAVVRDIETILQGVKLPPGYRVELGGQYEGQQETMRNLAGVSLAGLLLVAIVLVAQFGAIRPAIVVLLTTPLALVGALATLWATDVPLNASSLMGCVLLVGLVVKNGILLLEVTQEHVNAGMSLVEALVLAGERRLRPIAMTTLATLVGLLPLALGVGSGAELQRPLALAVIGGLSLATVLSLIVFPSLATLVQPRHTVVASD